MCYIKVMFDSQKAFTIVEIVIVIVIISILATIGIVVYSGVQQEAKQVSLSNDLRNAAEHVKLESFKDPASGFNLPPEVSVSEGNVLSASDHYGYRDEYCINGYATSTGEVYHIRPLYGLKSGLCPSENAGSRIGGTFPEPIFGINRFTDVRDWQIANNAGTLNDTNTEFVLNPGANGRMLSPMTISNGSRTVTVRFETYATQTSPTYAGQNRSGVSIQGRFWQSDGETSVHNSLGSNNQTITESIPLNQWSTHSMTLTTGPLVRNLTVQFNANSSTSDNRIRNIEIILNQ